MTWHEERSRVENGSRTLAQFPLSPFIYGRRILRFEDGWLQQTYNSMEDSARLEDLGCDLPLAAIYRGISFPNPQ